MPIPFRCPACDRRLSIATRKAGTRTTCPNCKAVVTVPGAPAAPETDSEAEGPSTLRTVLATACVALFLFGGLSVALALALRKPADRAPEQAKVDSAAVAPVQQPEPVLAKPQAAVGEQKQPAPSPSPPAPQPQPPEEAPPPRPAAASQPTPTPQPTPVPAPPVPHPQPQPPPPQPQHPLDRFGNPIGAHVGLGKDGEFKGQKLLFWCAFENAGRVFFHSTNPLWKALEAKGFIVRAVFGRFNPAWLKEADQLWIVSSGRFEVPGGLSPDLVVGAVDLLPPELVPSGFTVPEYKFIVGATLDVALSPRHQLDEKAFKAIEEFVKAGKGLPNAAAG